MKIEEANIDGFLSIQGENWGHFRFIAPCTINRSELPLETLARISISHPLDPLHYSG